MKDCEILALFRQKDPKAIDESRMAYGDACRQLASNLLDNAEEAEAVFEAVLVATAKELGEGGPSNVEAYLIKATHRAALEAYWEHSKTRGKDCHFHTVTDELTECPTPMSNSITLTGIRRASKTFEGFFKKLGAEGRDIFICRYFYGDSLAEIARRFGLNETQVAAKLTRMRKRFHRLAEREEMYIDEVRGMTFYMETLPGDMILAAHKGDKRWRRGIPFGIVGVVVVVVLLVYPYLQEAINTDLTLRPSDWRDTQEDGTLVDGAQPKPDLPAPNPMNVPVTLGDTTLMATAVTDTTVTLKVIKKDATPIYAMIYDRKNEALASTEEGYKVGGAVIRYRTLKLSVDGGDTVYTFPTLPGTYEVVVNFASLRNGSYSIQDLLGVYAYMGEEDAPPSTVCFDLTVPAAEEETTAPDTTDNGTESDTP